MATKLEVWKTEDGSIFYSEQEALAHESRCKRETELDKIVSNIHFREMDEYDLKHGLIDNAKELCDILSNYVL